MFTVQTSCPTDGQHPIRCLVGNHHSAGDEVNLGHLLDQAIISFPDRVAVYDDSRSYTFAELGERVYRLGNWLLSQGLKPGDGIGSLQYNSIETIEIELAASKFGFSRTLLNARGTVAEHINALNAMHAKLLIYSDDFAAVVEEIKNSLSTLERCAAIGAATASTSEYERGLASSSVTAPTYEVTPEHTHSVYFTSGTTGKTKGIVLSQRNWMALVRNHLVDTYADARETDVVLHAAPMSHASGALIFAHLVRGAKQKVIHRFDADEVLDAFERDRVTTLWLAPTMVHMLIERMRLRRRDVSALRSMRYGGAPMAAQRVREAVECFGPVLCSGWGQWEAPQQCTFLSQAVIAEAVTSGNHARLASAGRSMTFGEVAIADDDGNLLPFDAEGEVVVAGDHLMVGYLDQPEETAALRFGRWQRTGDVGRLDKEGFLYLTDRKKDLIISGGSNIYPREVEEVLYAHAAVLEAIAIGIPDDRWGETVHALVVLRHSEIASTSTEDILEWCKRKLADYKRPRSVEFVTEFPKNAYGKILRKDIRARHWANAATHI